MRPLRTCRALAVLLPLLGACRDADGPRRNTPANLPARTFRMGFSAIPPTLTNESVLATINAWSPRADAAIMHVSIPYKALLVDSVTAAAYVNAIDLPLANLYRSKGFPLVVTLDVTDGLNRAAEAPELVQLGRSIAETAVQAAYRQYALAIDTLIRPDYLGLAAETNLIRELAPSGVYAALVTMTNSAAADVRAAGGKVPKLYASVQADVAWGPPPAAYKGVETDFQDFPFNEVIAISSYPYFTFADPDQIPLDYYTRLEGARALPIMVVEGGWTSGAAGAIQSSPATQARYLRRQERLLDSAKAIAVFQLNYTDIDLAGYPPQPPGSTLVLFTSVGLVDAALQPKLALATYDSIFARPRTP